MEHLSLILIADRNRNVRELLKREMSAEGYCVRTAASAAQVFEEVSGPEPPDLVVLDLDLPDAGGAGIIEELKSRMPYVPVIVHTLGPEHADLAAMNSNVGFVEKQGDSVEELKRMVCRFLGISPKTPAVPGNGYVTHPD